MLPVKFRQTLRQEVDRWRSEGTIDSDLHAKLAARYQFDRLESESSGAFISALMGLGAILIGLGVLSFVAVNWQYLDKFWRIAVLVGALLAVNISGFYLWQRSSSKRLAQGLLLLGGLVLGANMALLAQLFHISGETFILFMGWSIGVTIMAYALRMTSLAAMAIALMGCGYWGAAMVGDARAIAPLWAQWLYEYMPLCSLALFLPLVYRCRSAVVFLLTAIAWLSSFQFTATSYTFGSGDSVDRLAVICGCSLPPLLLWAYGRIQGYLLDASYSHKITQFSQRLAIFSGALTCYTLSFNGFVWGVLRLGSERTQLVDNWWSIVVLFVPIAIGLWIWLGKLTSRWQTADRQIAGLGLGMAGLLALAASSLTMSAIVAWGFLLLLAVITLMGIQSSLQTGDRAAFYFNWLLLATRILSWFAFMQVDLAFKSLLFVLSGFATIAVGIWFERRHLKVVRPS